MRLLLCSDAGDAQATPKGLTSLALTWVIAARHAAVRRRAPRNIFAIVRVFTMASSVKWSSNIGDGFDTVLTRLTR